MSRTLARQMARAEELHEQIKAAKSTDDLLRLSEALNDATRAVCRTVEMEMELELAQRQRDRAIERRKRELRRLVVERLAALPPAGTTLH